MQPYYDQGGITIYHQDCRDVLAALPAQSVDLIVTDPPYFRVKAESWDRQWDTTAGFLAWLGSLATEWQRVLRPNGSLFVFASPAMTWHVEGVIRERFNVLNTIRWVKEAGWHQKAEKEALRSFLSPWEALIFAEHYGADSMALGESRYAAQCDDARGLVFEPIRAYLDGERRRAGKTFPECVAACGFRPGSGMAGHYFSRSQWSLPTPQHYAALRRLFNGDSVADPPEYLCREYEDLCREYEDLRREYEDLRRPFALTARADWSDIWQFAPVPAMYAKHPCAKPVPLLEHIIHTSSRPDAVVLDCFLGSGASAVAARNLGRRFIGVDTSARYLEWALGQLAQQVLPLDLGA